MREDQERKVFVMVQTKEAERKALHDVARVQGYGSLSDFTRAAWAAMMTGAVNVTPGDQTTQVRAS